MWFNTEFSVRGTLESIDQSNFGRLLSFQFFKNSHGFSKKRSMFHLLSHFNLKESIFVEKDPQFTYKIESIPKNSIRLYNSFIVEFIIVSERFPEKNISERNGEKKTVVFFYKKYVYLWLWNSSDKGEQSQILTFAENYRLTFLLLRLLS